jgi:hypothetical protein
MSAMLSRREIAGLLGVVILGLVAAGCNSGPARIYPPAMSASAAGSGAMAKYDANKDGFIDSAELEKAPALKAALKQIDADNDGKITAAEVTRRVQQWQESKLGLTSVPVYVRLDHQPLADATVSFIPEEFLGTEIQKAVGKTDSNGMAGMSVEKTPEPGITGVAPGLYRVEISKQSGGTEQVPAKYNKETIIGLEIALDAPALLEGVSYDLPSK